MREKDTMLGMDMGGVTGQMGGVTGEREELQRKYEGDYDKIYGVKYLTKYCIFKSL